MIQQPSIDILRSLTDAINPFTVTCVQTMKRLKLAGPGELEIGSFLNSFASEFAQTHDGSMNVTVILRGLIQAAQRIRTQGVIAYPTETIDMILSSYINYIAKNYCKVDFSIRAADLEKPLG